MSVFKWSLERQEFRLENLLPKVVVLHRRRRELFMLKDELYDASKMMQPGGKGHRKRGVGELSVAPLAIVENDG